MFGMKTIGKEDGSALGWLSLAIGAAEVLAPKKVAQMLGLSAGTGTRGLLRTMGCRELAHGLSILATKRRKAQHSAAVSARVAGDLIDTALLGLAAVKTRRPLRFAAVAGTVLAIGAIDVVASSRLRRHAKASRRRFGSP